MTTHRGTAVLLLDDGRELTATANLHEDGAGAWGGLLTVSPEARTPEVLNLQEGRLRIRDRVGTFVKTDSRMELPSMHFQMEIQGTGDAPF